MIQELKSCQILFWSMYDLLRYGAKSMWVLFLLKHNLVRNTRITNADDDEMEKLHEQY